MAYQLPPGPGRPKGLPNKSTVEFKQSLQALLDYAAPSMVKWLEEIDDPFKRFDVLSKFAEYVHPKLGRTEVTGKDGEDIKVISEINVNLVSK